MKHDRAADVHDDDRHRHDDAAGYWAVRRDHEKVTLESRDANIDNDAAEVDRDRGRLERRREREGEVGDDQR